MGSSYFFVKQHNRLFVLQCKSDLFIWGCQICYYCYSSCGPHKNPLSAQPYSAIWMLMSKTSWSKLFILFIGSGILSGMSHLRRSSQPLHIPLLFQLTIEIGLMLSTVATTKCLCLSYCVYFINHIYIYIYIISYYTYFSLGCPCLTCGEGPWSTGVTGNVYMHFCSGPAALGAVKPKPQWKSEALGTANNLRPLVGFEEHTHQRWVVLIYTNAS